MGALEQLSTIKPQENAGASSSNRFDYQKSWGLKLLLEMELRNQDYVMIFDYHDDIVVCDSEKADKNIDFYQIKTKKNQNWTQNSFTEHNGSSKSILAKLLSHSMAFKGYARDFYFVTDSRLSNSILKKSEDRVPFKDLEKRAQDNFKNELFNEEPNLDSKVFDYLYFILNQMSAGTHDKTMIGEVAEFIDTNPKLKGVDIDARAFYNQMIGEINSRTNYEKITQSKEELIKRKSLRHSDFVSFINGLINLKRFDSICTSIKDELKGEGTFSERQKISKELRNIEVELKNYENDDIQRLICIIGDNYARNPIKEDDTAWSFVNRLYREVIKTYQEYNNRTPEFIKALILYEMEK